MTLHLDQRGSADGALPAAAAAGDDAHDCRCGCGNLLARLCPGGVELKCRRCKRVLTVPLAGASPGAAGAPYTTD